jgi:hypothetical protein
MTHDKMMAFSRQSSQDTEMSAKVHTGIDEVRLESTLGHKQELSRNFGLWSLTSLGIVIAK